MDANLDDLCVSFQMCFDTELDHWYEDSQKVEGVSVLIFSKYELS